jgi:hypothetical protein
VFRTNVVENSETHVLLPQAIAENRGPWKITFVMHMYPNMLN